MWQDNFVSDKKLIDRIQRTISCKNLSHAYILEGDRCTDKLDFAKEFIKAIECKNALGVGCDSCISCRKLNHGNFEDLHIISSDGKSVKDSMISDLQEELKKKPFGDRHFVIIEDSDTMTQRAQNRLLKTLEEPPMGTIIFLLSENSENLLATVRSRCIIYRLIGEKAEVDGMIKLAEALVNGVLERKNFFYTWEILDKAVKSKEDALELLDGMERIYHKILVEKDSRAGFLRREAVGEYISLIEECRRDVLANVRVSYALKNLIIKIGGIIR